MGTIKPANLTVQAVPEDEFLIHGGFQHGREDGCDYEGIKLTGGLASSCAIWVGTRSTPDMKG